VFTGNKITPIATVKLVINGKEKNGSAKGVGPVDALCKVIREVVDPNLKLVEFEIKAVSSGTDALGEVIITLMDKEGNKFKAQAINEDIIMASAYAIIKGANKALNLIKRKKPTDNIENSGKL
jgi:2-isopropylmalate synthase